MLLAPCIPLTGTLMLIHYYLVRAVDAGKLKWSRLKRKSKKHFFPNKRYICYSIWSTFLEASLQTQRTASPLAFYPTSEPPIRNTRRSTASPVPRVARRDLGCQCLALRTPPILTSLHLLKKRSSVSLHIMSGHNWQYYGNYVCSVTGVMFADHVLRKQESRLVQFQVCRQTKTLFLTVKQPYHKQSAALTKPCNATMIRSLPSRFMSHFFSQLRNTFGSQKKTRNGFKWLIYTSSKLRCSAMRCNAFS